MADTEYVDVQLVGFEVHNEDFLELRVRITDGSRKPRDVFMWIHENGDPGLNDCLRIAKYVPTRTEVL